MQIDFGKKLAAIENRERIVHLFSVSPSYSRRIFVTAYPYEMQVEWLDGLKVVFDYVGGIPATVLLVMRNRW